MATLTIVAAVAANGVIGRSRGGIPWSLPQDLARFKRITWGKAMVMGRRTFDAIGRPLPGRRTIVVTRDPDWSFAGAERADGFASAVTLADGTSEEIIVAGGAEIYALAVPVADRLRLTEVHLEALGDVSFPPVDWSLWRECFRESHPADAGRPGYSFVNYERR